MNRYLRPLILVAGALVLLLVVATLGYAFTRGGGPHMPKYPGLLAVRDGCGVEHTFFDGTDRKSMCLRDIFDGLSVSRNGKRLAWDTNGGTGILVSGVDGGDPANVSIPTGVNAAPSLAPDGDKLAFLHSPHDDGKYDIWVASTGENDAEQLTNTRNVSDVVWSPTGDWLAFVQNWSDETLEGQISLIRPNGDDTHTIGVSGDAPDWSPDGKHLVYVHKDSLWVADSDGKNAKELVRNAHSPAWSRDGDMMAFLRTKCAKGICQDHLMRSFANGTEPQDVGPVFPEERRVVWLPDPFE